MSDLISLYSALVHQDLHSFPTRRSSDLEERDGHRALHLRRAREGLALGRQKEPGVLGSRQAVSRRVPREIRLDRKSTRLNSSHRTISYAVFCLKKKR